MTGGQTQEPGAGTPAPGTTLRFAQGNPTAEEIAAVTAVVAALQGAASPADSNGRSTAARSSRQQRRRLLASAPQPWRSGRH